MASSTIVDESVKDQPLNTRNLSFFTQIVLRLLSIPSTATAAWLMLTNKETEVVYGIQADARYSYTPAFTFFAVVNIIAAGFSLLSMIVVVIILGKKKKPIHSRCYFLLFVHDLILGLFLMSGCASATAIGYVGKYGNDHTGWIAICDHFTRFCKRGAIAILFSYLGIVFYFILAVSSANGARQRRG